MESTSKDSPASSPKRTSSRSSMKNKESIRDSSSSSKAKERSRRARGRPATAPGAVPSSSSNRLERSKEKKSTGNNKRTSSASSVNKSPGGRKSRPSSAATKPGAVSSTGRDSRTKGSSSSRSSKSSHRTSKASSGSSTTRSSRPISENKRLLAMPARTDEVPSRMSPNNNNNDNASEEPEIGLVAEAVVGDTEMQATVNALNREVASLRQEIQRNNKDEEQVSTTESSPRPRRAIPLWGKVVCVVGSMISIGVIVWAGLFFAGDGGGDEVAVVAPTRPDGDTVFFDPPNSATCSKVSEGRPVDGQEDMTMQTLLIKVNVRLADTSSSSELSLWLPEMLDSIQQVVMPSVIGCGNVTTLVAFAIGNAQVAPQNNAISVPCEDQTNGPYCYIVEFPVYLFMKKEVVSYDDLNELNQGVEEVFQNTTSLVVNAQDDENSTAIKDIEFVTSVPVTPSPSQEPSSIIVLTSSPSTSSFQPSLEPTIPPTSGATTVLPTPLSTPGPTETTVSEPTLSPTLVPSRGPTMFPTKGPTVAPAPGPTIQPIPLPTIPPTVPPSLLPTTVPTVPPSPLPTIQTTPPPSLLPTPGPSIAPTSGPTNSPSRAPSPTPSLQTSAAPTSKCTRLEGILSRFAPFDGNKAQALNWLCVDDTWEPPLSATDEAGLWTERFALAVFYYATGGSGWSNNGGWLTSADVCSWTGIDDCNGDGSVTKFILWHSSSSNYGLVGDFPDEMRALSNLEYFRFAYNRSLRGTIPSFLTALTKLTFMGLGDTGRIGSIPSELWTLTKLQYLGLWGNYLTGTIPSGIGAMTELGDLHLTYNDHGLDSLTQLTAFTVRENFLNGSIPPLPSSLTLCDLAKETSNWIHYTARKTEGNCFTDTTNAGSCNLSKNCP